MKYLITTNSNSKNSLVSCNANNKFKNSYSKIVGLYDTGNIHIKVICGQKEEENITCSFIQITRGDNNNRYQYDSHNDNIFDFGSYYFSNKNCYYSLFNSEYLFCCAFFSRIKCYKNNINSYEIIKEFSILIKGSNSFLTIKSNENFLILFFQNQFESNYYVCEYYIYLPTCQDITIS